MLFYANHRSGCPTAGRHSSVGHDQGSCRGKGSIEFVRKNMYTDSILALLYTDIRRFGVWH